MTNAKQSCVFVFFFSCRDKVRGGSWSDKLTRWISRMQMSPMIGSEADLSDFHLLMLENGNIMSLFEVCHGLRQMTRMSYNPSLFSHRAKQRHGPISHMLRAGPCSFLSCILLLLASHDEKNARKMMALWMALESNMHAADISFLQEALF